MMAVVDGAEVVVGLDAPSEVHPRSPNAAAAPRMAQWRRRRM
jgi:hypothetical protein